MTCRCVALDAAVAVALRDLAAAADAPLDDAVERALAAPGPHAIVSLEPPPGTARHPHPEVALLVSAPRDATGRRVAGLLVHPRRRGTSRTRGVRTVAAALAEEAPAVAAATTLWVAGDDPERDVALIEAGWQLDREQLRLERPLPAPEPEPVPGVRLRSYRPAIDDEALVAVNNRAFAGHPDQGGWTPSRLAAAIAGRRGFRPADLLVAETEPTGRDLLGFCWTVLHPPAGPRHGPVGEIHVVGVDPAAQGRGLGRLLVLSGLAHLHSRGATTGMLYVTTTNRPARRLYEALGFRPQRRDRAFVRPANAPPGER